MNADVRSGYVRAGHDERSEHGDGSSAAKHFRTAGQVASANWFVEVNIEK